MTQSPLESVVNRRTFLSKSGVVLGATLSAPSAISLLAACESTSPSTAGSKTLIIGLEGETSTINQNLENSPLAYPMYSALHERLIYANPFNGGKLEPQLATSWSPSADKLTWEFKLRDGVKFHNGELFDAASVKASFDTMVALKPQSPTAARVSMVDRVEVVDKLTVRFITKQPWPLAPQNISEIVMLPKKALEEKGNVQLAQAPIGTGPFRFIEWIKGDHVTVEAYGGYWGPQPRIKTLKFRFLPDASSRVSALQAGEVQLAHKVTPDSIQTLKGAGMQVASAPAGTGIVLVMMQQPHPSPFANLALRKALNAATDKETILKQLLLGYGRVLDGQPVGPDCFGHDPSLKATAYDKEAAKRLLDEAHYDGSPITFWATDAFFTKQLDVAQAVNQGYHDLGIKTELKALDGPTFLTRQLQKQDLSPLYSGGWQYLPVMDADFPLQWYKSDSFLKTGLMDSTFDQAFAAQAAEFESGKRQVLLQNCMQILNRQAASVWLWQEHDIWATGQSVKGFKPASNLRPVWTEVSL